MFGWPSTDSPTSFSYILMRLLMFPIDQEPKTSRQWRLFAESRRAVVPKLLAPAARALLDQSSSSWDQLLVWGLAGFVLPWFQKKGMK
jgi:hypothetical protein